MSDSSSEIPARQPSAFGAWLRRNPVTIKELRGRMRGIRAFAVLTGYVAFMSLFTILLYGIYSISVPVTLGTSGGVIGKWIFGGVVAVELFLVCFIAPAFTASTISGERERLTYYLLRTTLLSANRLVMGKLLSALAFVFLLLLVAVPLQSLAFLMGGVTITEILLSIELLVVTAVAYGAAGIYFSAVTRRTLGASVLTYVFSLALTVVVPLVVGVVALLSSLWTLSGSLSGRTVIQPLGEMVLIYGVGLLACTNPITTAILTETTLLQYGSPFYFTQILSNGTTAPLVSPWIVYTVVCLLLTVFFVRFSVRAVRRPDE